MRYLVLLPIQRIELGAQFPKGQGLPMHCTLMQWFLPADGDTTFRSLLDNRLTALARGSHPLQISASHRAMFGPNNEVPVSVLACSHDLTRMHTVDRKSTRLNSSH